MQVVKGPTQSQRLAYELLRPVIHLLWAWGIPENVVRAQSERAYRRCARSARRGAHARPAAALEPLHQRAICACVDPHRLPELRRFVRLLAETFVESVEEKLLACTLRKPRGRGARKGRLFGVSVRVYTQAAPQPVRPPGKRPSHDS